MAMAQWTDDGIWEMIQWARNRLTCCDAALTGRNGDLTPEQVARYEQEQQTLRVVFRLIAEDRVDIEANQ